jgi:hypothetical protein
MNLCEKYIKKLIEIYKHYKNKKYEVLYIEIFENSLRKCVVYKALHEIPQFGEKFKYCPVFVREFKNFFNDVLIENRSVK